MSFNTPFLILGLAVAGSCVLLLLSNTLVRAFGEEPWIIFAHIERWIFHGLTISIGFMLVIQIFGVLSLVILPIGGYFYYRRFGEIDPFMRRAQEVTQQTVESNARLFRWSVSIIAVLLVLAMLLDSWLVAAIFTAIGAVIVWMWTQN